jgi:hypothetical protein
MAISLENAPSILEKKLIQRRPIALYVVDESVIAQPIDINNMVFCLKYSTGGNWQMNTVMLGAAR